MGGQGGPKREGPRGPREGPSWSPLGILRDGTGGPQMGPRGPPRGPPEGSRRGPRRVKAKSRERAHARRLSHDFALTPLWASLGALLGLSRGPAGPRSGVSEDAKKAPRGRQEGPMGAPRGGQRVSNSSHARALSCDFGLTPLGPLSEPSCGLPRGPLLEPSWDPSRRHWRALGRAP